LYIKYNGHGGIIHPAILIWYEASPLFPKTIPWCDAMVNLDLNGFEIRNNSDKGIFSWFISSPYTREKSGDFYDSEVVTWRRARRRDKIMLFAGATPRISNKEKLSGHFRHFPSMD
jgi:hypothetical protein